MMDLEEFLNVGKEMSEVVKELKEEMSQEEIEKELEDNYDEVYNVFTSPFAIARAVMNDEEYPGLSATDRTIMKVKLYENVAKEEVDEKLIKLSCELMYSMDVDLGVPIITKIFRQCMDEYGEMFAEISGNNAPDLFKKYLVIYEKQEK